MNADRKVEASMSEGSSVLICVYLWLIRILGF
jgi:hypothetical protein